MNKLFLSLISLIVFSIQIFGKVNIPLDDARIAYDGIWYAEKSPTKVILNRHLESIVTNSESGVSSTSLPYAHTQTGVRIRFKTKSKNIYMSFTERTDAGKVGLHNGFAVYADGNRYKVFESLNFNFVSPGTEGQAVLYEVVLPSLHGVNITGLSIDDGFTLEEISPLNKPVMAVIGTSISHGTGQQSSSFYTYPFIVASDMGWDLVNLAVAGAHTGWPMSLLFKGKKADYIIVELGFNDWYWDNKPLSSKAGQYNKLLDSLRVFQKNAKIICVTPIVTTYTTSTMGAGFRFEDFREMVRSIVTAKQIKGDSLLYIVHGDSLTNSAMLDDGVHLSEKGAQSFATALSDKIKEIINKSPVVDTTFKTLWERSKSSGSLPTWFSPASSTERGLAYANEKLYVVGRWGGNNIFMLDWLNGKDIGKVNIANVTGGTLALNDIEADQEGNIYSCNLANTNNEIFKIYKWKKGAENSEPEVLLSYNVGAERLGDNFNVSGSSANNLTILAASAKSDKVFRWKINNNTVNGPEILNLAAAPALGTVPTVAAKGNGENDGFYVSSYSSSPKEYDAAGNTKIGELKNGGGVLKTLNADKLYILHMRPILANLEVYAVDKNNIGAAPAERYGATISLGDNQNINQTGDVAYRRDSNGNTVFFVLSTNNGIAAFWAKKGNDLYKGNSLITGVEQNKLKLPLKYQLSQNYPNPFNPSTSIEYYNVKAGPVKLKIYDIAGKEIATLVNGVQQAGNYIVNFTAGRQLSSGFYLYRLTTDSFNETKKMVYIK